MLLGGTEIQTATLVKALASDGHKVSVVCFFEHCSESVRMMESAGGKTVLLDMQREQGLFPLLTRLINFFGDEGPDVVHVQYMAPGFIPVLAARLARVPTVFATVHQPGRTYGWKAKLLLRAASRLCDQFFCISRAVEKSWFGSSQLFNLDTMKKRGHCTIYNAVDVHKISAAAEKARKSGLKERLGLAGCKVIGCVGRLRKEKGQQWLIAALPEIIKHQPSARLLLVGSGPGRSNLEYLAKSFGVADSIIWIGAVPHDEVARYYGVMDVLVVPSEFEGFGLSAVEGMAAGLPVIGSRVDGLREIIRPGYNGFLVEPENISDLSSKILHILSNESSLSPNNGIFFHSAEEYSLSRYVSQIQKAYN